VAERNSVSVDVYGAVWPSGNALISINVVASRRAQFSTGCGWVNCHGNGM